MNLSQKYHAIFDYPLVKSDYPRWLYKDESITPLRINATKGQARKNRENISKNKLLIAKKASKILSKIPTVKFVGVTGSLAMMNAKKDSDIDLMIITKKGTLWTTRLLCYFSLITNHYLLRRPKLRKEKDMLCINLWLDETDIKWDLADRNIYTAHEIAQVMPLVNKDKTYEKFLWQNRWILNYWPSAVVISNFKFQISNLKQKINILEKIAFKLQYLYMRNKITREIISPTRAIFHPNDWGKVVMEKLKV